MKKMLLTVILFYTIAISSLCAAQTEQSVTLKTGTGTLEGSLLLPNAEPNIPVALIIAGSGPTDRNGNQPSLTNNALKMLAEQLANNGIASLRYDKRGIGKSINAVKQEAELRFEHYIADAERWLNLLKQDERFGDVIVIGHSEGSLIGMIAARLGKADKFISIAGLARPAGNVLKEQLRAQPDAVRQIAFPIIDKLNEGKSVDNVTPALYALFRPSVQPYMISWFKYDPSKEISKLHIPILIIQGANDIQVSVSDAELLAKANSHAEKWMIGGMNHIFKMVEVAQQQNLASYNQPDLPIADKLVERIVSFIVGK